VRGGGASPNYDVPIPNPDCRRPSQIEPARGGPKADSAKSAAVVAQSRFEFMTRGFKTREDSSGKIYATKRHYTILRETMRD